MLLFACLGVGTLVLLGGFIAIDIAIALGAGELLVTGAAAVARAPAAFTGMLRASATLANELWRVGSYYGELLPVGH
jgi:hypothetical protein